MTKAVFQYATCILGMVFMVLGVIAFNHPATGQLPPSFWHGILLIILGLQLISFWDKQCYRKFTERRINAEKENKKKF